MRLHVANAYDQGRDVERRGLERLRRWLSRVAHEGRWVWIARNAMAELIQRAGADIIIAAPDEKDWALDCKFIADAASTDAPFEVWSNLVLLPEFSKRDFINAGFAWSMVDRARARAGWGVTARSDLVLVYNLALDRGVIGRLLAWRELLNTRLPSGVRQWKLYGMREQGKRRQLNSSWCIWTPPSALIQRAGFQLFNARQLGLWERPELTLRLIGNEESAA